MTTTRFLAGIASLLMAGSASAGAADFGIPFKGTPAAPSSTWSGCHIGIHGGLGVGHNTWQDYPPFVAFGAGFVDANGFGETANTDMSGALVGGQIGCDYQFSGSWVVGIEGSGSASDITGTNFDQFNDTWSMRSKIDTMATATARLGLSVNNILIYGRGGAAWAHDRFEIENAETDLGTPQMWRLGWTAGGGIEWAFAPNWSAFLEVDYYAFSATNVAFPGSAFNGSGGATVPFTVSTSLSLETFKLGANYRF